ncbi:MAG: type IV pilin [Methanosarcinales archaeon]
MKKEKKGNRNLKGFSRDDKGVSSVLGVVLLISIVVVITSVIAAFVFGAVTGNKQSPCAELVVKNAVAGNQNITIVHYGGDGICVYSAGSGNIEIKYNGRVCNLQNNASLNGLALSPVNTYFNLGDELEVNLTYGATGDPTRNLTAGDSICIVYTPADCILQRVTVVSL